MTVHQYVLRISGQESLRSRCPQLVAVAHVNAYTVRRNFELSLEIGIIWRVSVAKHCLYWRYNTELIEDFAPSYVTGVEDQIHPCERVVNRWA